LGLPALNRLQDKYFPAPHPEEGKPGSAGKAAHTPGAVAVKDAHFRKTATEVILELRFDPRKKPQVNVKLRNQWAKAASRFFKAAGFRTVKIEV